MGTASSSSRASDPGPMLLLSPPSPPPPPSSISLPLSHPAPAPTTPAPQPTSNRKQGQPTKLTKHLKIPKVKKSPKSPARGRETPKKWNDDIDNQSLKSMQVMGGLREEMEKEKSMFPGALTWAQGEAKLFEVLFMRQYIPILPSHWGVDFRALPMSNCFSTPDGADSVIYAHGKEFQATMALTRLIDLTSIVRTTCQSGLRYKAGTMIKKGLESYISWAAEDGGYKHLRVVPNIIAEIVDPKKGEANVTSIIQDRMQTFARLQKKFWRNGEAAEAAKEFWDMAAQQKFEAAKPKKRVWMLPPPRAQAGANGKRADRKMARYEDIGSPTRERRDEKDAMEAMLLQAERNIERKMRGRRRRVSDSDSDSESGGRGGSQGSFRQTPVRGRTRVVRIKKEVEEEGGLPTVVIPQPMIPGIQEADEDAEQQLGRPQKPSKVVKEEETDFDALASLPPKIPKTPSPRPQRPFPRQPSSRQSSTPPDPGYRRRPPVVYGFFIVNSTVLVLSADSSRGENAYVSYHVNTDFLDRRQSIWNALTLAMVVCMARDEMRQRVDDFEPLEDKGESSDPDA